MGSEPKMLSFIFLFKSVFWDIYERLFYHLAYLIALSLSIRLVAFTKEGRTRKIILRQRRLS